MNHGPVCIGLDAGCPDCLALQAARAEQPRTPPESADYPSDAELEHWRAEADRLQRTATRGDNLRGGDVCTACQRIATLIDALRAARAEFAELNDAVGALSDALDLDGIRDTVPQLIDEIDRLRALAERQRAELDGLKDGLFRP